MSEVSASSWEELQTAVAGALTDLPEGGFLVLGEPVPDRPRAGGLRGLLGGRAPAPPTRFVQARRDGDTFGVECVGATSFGGTWPLEPDADARLRDLGWLAPGDEGWEPMGGPFYRTRRAATDLSGTAALLVGGLRRLGVERPGRLELTTGP